MCRERLVGYCDTSADKLAVILSKYVSGPGMFKADDVRRMLILEWSKVSTLAHAVHDQESDAIRTLERQERAELKRLKEKYES